MTKAYKNLFLLKSSINDTLINDLNITGALDGDTMLNVPNNKDNKNNINIMNATNIFAKEQLLDIRTLSYKNRAIKAGNFKQTFSGNKLIMQEISIVGNITIRHIFVEDGIILQEIEKNNQIFLLQLFTSNNTITYNTNFFAKKSLRHIFTENAAAINEIPMLNIDAPLSDIISYRNIFSSESLSKIRDIILLMITLADLFIYLNKNKVAIISFLKKNRKKLISFFMDSRLKPFNHEDLVLIQIFKDFRMVLDDLVNHSEDAKVLVKNYMNTY